ncbi:MAG TPA: YeeE/YedE thiosulfate transporter family protein, partial [Sphingomonas sp.]|nr:YeeE/YedE thiosulfate transporter family protein [Sphingomonas sp.]
MIALAAAGLMGFANQRGGTCTVAAIEEIAATRRFGRMIALLEASLWVGGGLVVLNAVNCLPPMPAGYAAGLATIAGGILFGLGAFVNGACLFGTVARLGSGEWAYAATPVGLFLGSLVTARLRFAEEIHEPSLVLRASAWGAVVALALIAVRLYTHGADIRRNQRPILTHLWSPHVATTMIGIAFLVAFLMAGNWDYPEFLRDLAQGDTVRWLP